MKKKEEFSKEEFSKEVKIRLVVTVELDVDSLKVVEGIRDSLDNFGVERYSFFLETIK